jgi:hypothetical protein
LSVMYNNILQQNSEEIDQNNTPKSRKNKADGLPT